MRAHAGREQHRVRLRRRPRDRPAVATAPQARVVLRDVVGARPPGARPRDPDREGSGSLSAAVSASDPARVAAPQWPAPRSRPARPAFPCESGPQPAHQGAGVDVDRADGGAHAVGGAGLARRRSRSPRPARPPARRRPDQRPPLLAAQHDPLPRRQRQRPRGADRLAEAALHAAVDLALDLGHDLEVAQPAAGVVGQHDTGVQHAVRGRPGVFSSRITSVSAAPYCRSTKGAMIRPVPCSAFSVPPSPSTRSTMSVVKAS